MAADPKTPHLDPEKPWLTKRLTLKPITLEPDDADGFTPGPLVVSDGSGEMAPNDPFLRFPFDVHVPDGLSTAVCVREADARLYAVAPEMYEALKELLSGHDNLYVAHFGPRSDPHNDIAAKAARAVLAKAEGK